MTTRSITAGLALVVLLALSGCAGSDPEADRRSNDDAAPPPPTSSAGTPDQAQPSAPPVPSGPLVGAFDSGTIPISRMKDVARDAGFKQQDIVEYFDENFGDAHDVVYTLKLSATQWVAFVTIDGGSAEETWSGPYEVVDASTVRAGAPPCGPITYDYTLQDDQLSLQVRDDDCPGPDGQVPAGELIAQTTIYETVPYTRVG